MTEPLSEGILEQADKRQHEVFETIALGEEAKIFCRSKLFEYICNAAEKKVIDAQVALGTVDPDDKTEIVRLQTVIARFDHFTSSLNELVTAGDSAYRLYRAQLEQQD